MNTSLTNSKRSIENSFCQIRFISAWVRNSGEGILCEPFVGYGKVYHLLKAFHVTDNRILCTMLFCLQIKLKLAHQFPIHFPEQYVFNLVIPLNEFHEVFKAVVITPYGNLDIIRPNQFPAIVIVFLEYIIQGFGSLVFSLITVYNGTGRYNLALQFHILVDLVEFHT